MTRAETTKFLGQLLINQYFSGMGKHWASEVSVDPWSTNGKRVDFMQFSPENQMSISGIEKGIFTCYEVKSCKKDVYSGNGLNFIGEKNYIVMTMKCYKDILPDLRENKFVKYLHNNYPGSSDYFGVMVALPKWRECMDEFENPTPLSKELDQWKLSIVLPCRNGPRYRSATELLFCMLRSGR
ncbi:hypothetical protein DW068_06150 [Anaerobutyricum hallii]|uniref:Uncharacterized protein n=1 Tax=Anaerobutyricum hallii TaxID=39488 RepID=A0A415G8E8_9FIRM|nr:hypothetical protein DW068_06150 [Anaerobutyricum hallii]